MPLQDPLLLQKLILGHKDAWPLLWIWCPGSDVGSGKKFQAHREQINPGQSLIGLLRSTEPMRKSRHRELIEVVPPLMGKQLDNIP